MSVAVRVIPCLDVDAGRVVKGVNFKDLRDAGDPVELAARYNSEVAGELVFLDITSSSGDRSTTYDIVTRTAEQVFIPLTVGGGIRTLDNIKTMLHAGADKVAINSAAVSNPEFVQQAAERFGSQCIVVAIDAKQVADNHWEIFTHGGRKETGIDAIEWAQEMERLGAGELLVTSMDRDGTKNGFDLPLMQRLSETVQIPIIASGGVGNLQHLVDGVLEGKADAVLAASIFHFGTYTIGEAKAFMADAGIEMRIE